MLPTHRYVETHGEFEIFLRDPGWEFTPGMLGKVASFIVRREDGEWVVFAFMYSMLHQLDGIEIDEERLIGDAVRVITERLDTDPWMARAERSFEFDRHAFVEVRDPRWWIPTG